MEQKDELTGQMQQHKYADLAKVGLGFDVVAGHARFTGPDTLEVDGRPLHARSYLGDAAAGAA